MTDQRNEIFTGLKMLLSGFVPPLSVRNESERQYDLYGTKQVIAGKKEFDGMYFASAVIQKNFVGFYFFPIYTHPQEFIDTPEGLKKCLKGKSCFHIKQNDKNLLKQIKTLLKKGLTVYKKAGWI